MILLIGEITKNVNLSVRLVLYDYTKIIFGLFASISTGLTSWFFLTISCYQFLGLIKGIGIMYDNAIAGRSSAYLNRRVRFRLISFSTGEMLYGISDIAAKVFLTLILVNTTVETTQNEKLHAMVDIAKEMESELSNSEALLQRMMPPEVIDQLKSGTALSAEEYKSVTVFFSEVTNFTVLASKSNTKDVINTFNKLWLEYDKIARKWGVCKVESIGNAYLAVLGCPKQSPDHPLKAVEFALEVIEMVRSFKTQAGSSIKVRVGLHTGPITAGILGDLNPRWCIVGDTVTIASKIQYASKPMQVKISESTYERIKTEGFKFKGPEIVQINHSTFLRDAGAPERPAKASVPKTILQKKCPQSKYFSDSSKASRRVRDKNQTRVTSISPSTCMVSSVDKVLDSPQQTATHMSTEIAACSCIEHDTKSNEEGRVASNSKPSEQGRVWILGDGGNVTKRDHTIVPECHLVCQTVAVADLTHDVDQQTRADELLKVVGKIDWVAIDV
ncbi:nucleotide cyclase [Gorgonomyces haynaldii]|nr:nucleotide cyclase [Gorgonomyces haynaldii]